MSWSVRHEGSPRHVEVATLPELIEGLQDGHWEPTDEVKGPGDRDWVAVEDHPALADVAADLEPPPAPGHADETHLDMNALIDVCLVLLIFFILTTSVALLQKMLEQPEPSAENADGAIVLTEQQAKDLLIQVTLRRENGRPVIRVEGEEVSRDNLTPVLRRFANGTKKTELLLDYDAEVPHGLVVAVQDAAKGAGLARVHYQDPEKAPPSK